MKKILTFLILATSFGRASAQTVQTIVNPDFIYRYKRQDMLTKLIGLDETGYYYMFHDVTSWGSKIFPTIIKKFDQNFIKTDTLVLDQKIYGYVTINTFLINDTLLIFHTKYNEKEKSNSVCCSYFDKNIKPIKTLELFQYTQPLFSFGPGIDIKISDDSSKIMFLTYFHSGNPDSKTLPVNLNIFDLKMNRLNDLSYKIPYTDKLIRINDWGVSNQGDAFLLCAVDIPKKKKNSDIFPKDISCLNILYRFPNGKKEPNTLMLESKKFFYDNAFIKMDENNENLIIFNFYKDENDGPIMGVEFMKYNLEKNEITTQTERNFSGLNLCGKDSKAPIKDKKDKDINHIAIKKLSFTTDGGIFVLAEHSDHQTFIRQTDILELFDNLNIILIKIDENGAFEWIKAIPKRHSLATERESNLVEDKLESYAIMERKNDILLFYNEHEENMKYDLSENHKELTIKDLENAVVAMVKITPDGSLTKTTAFNGSPQRILIAPSHCKQINDHELFFTTFYYQKMGLGKFTVND